MNELDKFFALDRTEERRILHQIVEKALECNACLMELVNFALAYVSKDVDVVTQKMCIALKVLKVFSLSVINIAQRNLYLTICFELLIVLYILSFYH